MRRAERCLVPSPVPRPPCARPDQRRWSSRWASGVLRRGPHLVSHRARDAGRPDPRHRLPGRNGARRVGSTTPFYTLATVFSSGPPALGTVSSGHRPPAWATYGSATSTRASSETWGGGTADEACVACPDPDSPVKRFSADGRIERWTNTVAEATEIVVEDDRIGLLAPGRKPRPRGRRNARRRGAPGRRQGPTDPWWWRIRAHPGDRAGRYAACLRGLQLVLDPPPSAGRRSTR